MFESEDCSSLVKKGSLVSDNLSLRATAVSSIIVKVSSRSESKEEEFPSRSPIELRTLSKY